MPSRWVLYENLIEGRLPAMSIFRFRYIRKMQKAQRIEALTDGVFAIVMTILVLELALEGHGPLREELAAMGGKIFQYFMTFIILGSTWMVHYYQYIYINSWRFEVRNSYICQALSSNFNVLHVSDSQPSFM